MESQNELINLIYKNFELEIPESAVFIINQDKFPLKIYDLESKAIYSYFKGKKWNEIEIQFLQDDPDCMYFLNLSAFLYYMPCFMIFSLKEYTIIEEFSARLLRWLSEPEGIWGEERLFSFKISQLNVIIAWLEALAKSNQIDSENRARVLKALENVRCLV